MLTMSFSTSLLIFCTLQIGLTNSEFSVDCYGVEAVGFEKRVSWNDTCDAVCQYNCDAYETLSNCSTSVAPASCGTSSTCVPGRGCVCNDPITKGNTLEETIIHNIYCYNDTVDVSLDKCAMNHYGYGIGDIFFGRPNAMSVTEFTANPPNSSCYGRIVYADRPTYKLTFKFGLKDTCNITTKQNATHLTFLAGVHAIIDGAQSIVDRSSALFLQFDCSYSRTFTKSYGEILPNCSSSETLVNGSCVGATYYAGRLQVVNILYDDRLEDPSSPHYIETKSNMEKVVGQLFLEADVNVTRAIILDFSPGSVLVDYAVEVATTLNVPTAALLITLEEITTKITTKQLNSNTTGVDNSFLQLFQFGNVTVRRAGRTETEAIVNPCNSGTNDCHAKAICIPSPQPILYSCSCAIGYVDLQPSRPGRICHSACYYAGEPYCLNSGVCVVDPTTGRPACLCQGNFEGSNCEKTRESVSDMVLQILPWVAVGVLILFVIILLVMYARRRRYLRKSFTSHAFLPDTGPSNSDAVVGLMQHGPTMKSFLE